jgi:hypothetical protein
MEGSEEKDVITGKKAKYAKIIEWIFTNNFDAGKVRIPFTRQELVAASDSLGFDRIKNLGDIPYSFRFRRDLPSRIQGTAPEGKEWIILGAGIGLYEFRLALSGKVVPTGNRLRIKVPDATPEIVRLYAPGTDEQALLTRARYNRLIDIFTGLTCYSVQNHLRTTIEGIGQVESMRYMSVLIVEERILSSLVKLNRLGIVSALYRLYKTLPFAKSSTQTRYVSQLLFNSSDRIVSPCLSLL